MPYSFSTGMHDLQLAYLLPFYWLKLMGWVFKYELPLRINVYYYNVTISLVWLAVSTPVQLAIVSRINTNPILELNFLKLFVPF